MLSPVYLTRVTDWTKGESDDLVSDNFCIVEIGKGIIGRVALHVTFNGSYTDLFSTITFVQILRSQIEKSN